ncbi:MULTISPECIES: hypothetical protein [Sphingobacterium]|uniref:Long-chain fatty acid transport protein n=1 Tax=Sphingobacterium populi TaxID=1812824 RepID=A0ABW5UC13_9SPHI|nr:hypothetical protein [Sphingobacterium sp. CFCC 11742]
MKNRLLRVAFSILLSGGALSLGLTAVHAQTTTSHSPYSQFGLGQMREDLTPQQRSMGGIAAGLRYLGGLPTLNVSNPASYSAMNRTIFDGSMYGNFTQLGKGSGTDQTADFAFGHITFGIPLKKAGGLSFGLLPYSDVGYNAYEDQNLGDLRYRKSIAGDGGLNKAYFGYGVNLPIKGLSIGANAGYLFGNLTDRATVEFPNNAEIYNTIQTNNRYVRGFMLDYGMQYFRSLGNRMSMTIGYSGTLNNQVRNENSSMGTITSGGGSALDAIALDTIISPISFNQRINLPLKHNIGITVSKGYNWTVGADFKYADWSYMQQREGQAPLGKNIGVALGGQFKPDPTSPKYFNIVDYRLGLRYNQTEVTLNNRRVNDMAISAGFGIPLAQKSFGRTFSMLNITGEFGQRGTLQNNLVRERYINIHLGFTINDTWFVRGSID